VKRKIFVDLDGVLADFDKAAAAILKTDNIYRYEFMHGAEEFWKRVHTDKNFFGAMEPMEDSWDLMGGIPSRREHPDSQAQDQWRQGCSAEAAVGEGPLG
jgi:hypothetical protein